MKIEAHGVPHTMDITVHHHFEAAHSLPWHAGKCRNEHGHRWEAKVFIQPGTLEVLNGTGILVDFGDVKDVIDQLDHRNLNDFISNPTAENIAIWISDAVAHLLRPDYFWFIEVELWESPECSIRFSRTWGEWEWEEEEAEDA